MSSINENLSTEVNMVKHLFFGIPTIQIATTCFLIISLLANGIFVGKTILALHYRKDVTFYLLRGLQTLVTVTNLEEVM